MAEAQPAWFSIFLMALCGLSAFAVISIAIVLAVVAVRRNPARADELARLRAENERLKAEVERLKDAMDTSSTTAIKEL